MEDPDTRNYTLEDPKGFLTAYPNRAVFDEVQRTPELFSYLQGINQLNLHPLRGSIFETFVVSELVKKRTNLGKGINLFYWRDKTGHEVDIIIDDGLTLLSVEIKVCLYAAAHKCAVEHGF